MKKDPYAPVRDTQEPSPTFWRSLEHKDGEASIKEAQDAEFPNGLAPAGGFNRRDALKLAGASLAMSAMTGCVRRPEEEILPFVRAPENVIPGNRLHYATSMPRSEGALGLLVESHEGRPTKIEGNPLHPSSQGASDIWAQAEVLRLYDPERRKTPLSQGQPASWESWDTFAKTHFTALAQAQGKGLALLLEESEGPTAARLLKRVSERYPEAKLYRWDPTAPDAALQGAQLAFGPGTRVHYDLEKAQILFALESDFLATGPEHLVLARQFGRTRAVHTEKDVEEMKRLYASEAGWSVTGTNADHRLRLASGAQVDLLKAVARELVEKHGLKLGAVAGALAGGALGEAGAKFAAAVAKDLARHAGRALVLVGDRQPAAVHALGYAVNVALGALGESMKVSQGEATPRTGMGDSLAALTRSLLAGEVQTLLILEANPVYTAPAALKFGEALAKAGTVIHAGLFAEETGAKATWHLPLAHFLESWSDALAWDGTPSIVQPLILPLFNGRPLITLLAQVTDEDTTVDKSLVEDTWRASGAPLADAKAWRRALYEGQLAVNLRTPAKGTLDAAAVAAALGGVKAAAPTKDALEFIATQGHVKDGRLTNVSWIMELPDTVSKLCWDNAILVSPSTAKELGIQSRVSANKYTSDVVELSAGGLSLKGPTFVLPGVANNTLVLLQGYGRTRGEVATGIGVDANALLTQGTVVQGVKLTKTGATTDLCSTQDHFSVPGNPFKEMTFADMTTQPADARERKLGLGTRPLFRAATGAEFVKNAEKVVHEGDMPEELQGPEKHKSRPTKPLQLTDPVTYEGQQWGMVIDLSSCIGCNICAIACVAENNIPTVGRHEVLLGREMHWIRVDRYFSGDVEQPLAVHQPVGCAHCENAPCEPVCPVSATVHDEEGINSMAYNRCIGTRYCSNNCPYKVRRFNYLDFTHTGILYTEESWKKRMATLKLQRNPDVTVRYRGVMEKCTYCTQRIEEAKMAAKRAGKDRKALPDGAVTPACAQACPTSAITFGNINDEQSKVAQLKVSERNYEMLQELNIRPRTTYLARVRNVNEELA